MSAMDNHRKRSSRGTRVKCGAFGNLTRQACIRPARFQGKSLGVQDLVTLFRGGSHGRRSKAVSAPAKLSAEE